ncbi:hypothetical protein [Mycobacteroides abscessus]|uniref:hypothetical protein n=1 Tax=Mycobacteroides abscessus TaxID=36809 RepID=UPI000C2622E0|nr:hypothetical protein [Mycobacteroides abscessus]
MSPSVAVAGGHLVTYTVWVGKDDPLQIAYVDEDGDPDNTEAHVVQVWPRVSPDDPWVVEVALGDPAWSARVVVTPTGSSLLHVSNPQPRCEIKVDAAIKATGSKICSLQPLPPPAPLRAGFGPPRTM